MDKTFLSWKRIWKCHLQNGAIYWWLFFISGMGTLEGQHPKKSWQEFSSKFWTVYKVLYWFLPLACWVFENCLHHNLIKQHFVFEIDIHVLWMKWVKIFIVFTRYLPGTWFYPFLHFQADWTFWPAAQAVNFYVLPSHLRVIYVAFATLCWNTFLSYMKHKVSIVECRYNAVNLSRCYLWHLWQEQNLNQTLNSQQTPHSSPSWASYGVSIVSIWEKIDCVITTPHCSLESGGCFNVQSGLIYTCWFSQKYSDLTPYCAMSQTEVLGCLSQVLGSCLCSTFYHCSAVCFAIL